MRLCEPEQSVTHLLQVHKYIKQNFTYRIDKSRSVVDDDDLAACVDSRLSNSFF